MRTVTPWTLIASDGCVSDVGMLSVQRVKKGKLSFSFSFDGSFKNKRKKVALALDGIDL